MSRKSLSKKAFSKTSKKEPGYKYKVTPNQLNIGFISYKKELLYRDRTTAKYLPKPTPNTITEERYKYIYCNNEKDVEKHQKKGFIGLSSYYKAIQRAINLNEILKDFIKKYRMPTFYLIDNNITITERRKSLLKYKCDTIDFISTNVNEFNLTRIQSVDLPLNDYVIHSEILKQLPFIFEYGAILLFRPECELVFREEKEEDIKQANDNKRDSIDLLKKIDSCQSIKELNNIKQSLLFLRTRDNLEEMIKNISTRWNDIEMFIHDQNSVLPKFRYFLQHKSLNLQINFNIAPENIKEFIDDNYEIVKKQMEQLDEESKITIEERDLDIMRKKIKTIKTFEQIGQEYNISADTTRIAFNRAKDKVYELFRFKDSKTNKEFFKKLYPYGKPKEYNLPLSDY